MVDARALHERAREVLSDMAYAYFVGGADDELTLADNVEGWQRIRLLPHVLRDVSHVVTRTEILGSHLTAPILIAPMATHRLAHDEGEKATARASASAGTLMVVSTMATVSLEDVAAAAPDGDRWFQLYVHRDRGVTAELVARAEAAGYSGIVLTVDVPMLGRRRRDEMHRFALPEGMAFANLDRTTTEGHGSALADDVNLHFDPSLTFDDVSWLAGETSVPLLVKGVLRPDDAVEAVDAGAAGVIVSNHGGRQLDSAIATADALLSVTSAVDGRVPVLVDGGIRSGTDVVKALALGASAVLIGRPVLWSLAVGGSDGVLGLLDELIEETQRAMALCGATRIDEIERGLIAG